MKRKKNLSFSQSASQAVTSKGCEIGLTRNRNEEEKLCNWIGMSFNKCLAQPFFKCTSQ